MSRLAGAGARLLVLNPNTNEQVTANIRSAAEPAVAAGTRLTVCNPPRGPFAIEDAADRAEAEPNVMELIRAQAAQYDAVVMACFDDIALDEARHVAGCPVIGAVEAALTAALALAPRFSVVTTVVAAVPTIVALLERYGAADVCTVRAAGIGVAEAASGEGEASRKIAAAIADAVRLDGAKAVILGSGGLAGRAGEFAAAAGVPVIDAILAAVRMAEDVASARGRTAVP
ncbi:MAG: Asp/Glu racemase [Proteobacteria bacterium]|nr:Asp/Glu racemase [Pseudomonadota bacterium]